MILHGHSWWPAMPWLNTTLFYSNIDYCQDSVLVAWHSFDPKVPGSNPGKIFFVKILNSNVLKLLFKYENLVHIKNLQSYQRTNAKKLSEIWQPQGLNCRTLAYKNEMLGNDLFLSKFSILNCKNSWLDILEMKI